MAKLGRPSDYNNEETIKKTLFYIENYEALEDKIPSVAGLADYLDVVKKTLYNWAEEHEDFLHALGKLKQKQEKVLSNKGLSGEFNSTITKLMLSHNHDYKERSDVTSGEKPIPLIDYTNVRNNNSNQEDTEAE